MKFYITRKTLVGVILVLCAIIFILTMSGCGSKREESTSSRSITRTTTVQEKTVATPEGPAVAEMVKTTTVSETATKGELSSETTIQAPPIMRALAPAAEAAANTTPWGGIALGIATAISGAWAAHKTAQSREREIRANELKRDADEGWELAHQNALKVPPKAEG